MRFVSRFLTVLLAPLATAPLAAQKVHLTPTIGVYAPTADLVNEVIQGQQFTVKQTVGVSLGARLGVSFSPRLGLIATGQYVPSNLQVQLSETGASQDFEGKSDLWFGSGRLAFWILPVTAPVYLGLNGGVGVAGRGETTVNGVTSQGATDVGGVVGGTVGIRLGGLGLSLTVDDYIYNATVFEQIGAKPKTQNDLHFSLGLGIPLGS